METLVFETALGFTAVARKAGPAASTGRAGRATGAGSERNATATRPTTRQGARPLLALSFGHASEAAALKALVRTLARVGPAKTLPDSVSLATAVYLSRVAPDSDELVDRLCAFAAGDADSFDDLAIDASHLTPFGRTVTAACRQISWGETLTYGELASRAGRPGTARAVGSVMARNRVPLIVPCHRVVPATGGLGGFSAPQGVAMKRRLLELEQGGGVLLSS